MSEVINAASAVPEMFMAVAAMALLMYGVFSGPAVSRTVSWLAVAVIVVPAALLILQGDGDVAFGGLFLAARYALYAKLSLLAGSSEERRVGKDGVRPGNS